jgi:hypothetical protein
MSQLRKLSRLPLDVAGLRKEWDGIRETARALQPASLPPRETIGRPLAGPEIRVREAEPFRFRNLVDDGGLGGAVVPDGLQWLSASTKVGAKRTGQVFAATLLDHYRETLREIKQTGYGRQTLTERLIDKARARKSST